MFVHLAFLIDDIPEKITTWACSGECHWGLIQLLELSDYKVRQLFESHYGKGICTCPMAGKRAAELVAQKLDELLQLLFQEIQPALRLQPPVHGAAPMTLAEWGWLINNCTLAAASALAVFRLKTEFWQVLPWLFVGLACVDEEEARRIAVRIVEAWNLDPRKAAHGKITWQLMRGGAKFKAELMKFISCISRAHLSVKHFLKWVAIWRLIPIVEHTIEEKHSRVAVQSRTRRIGPTRVSLCNRLPMFVRLLLRKQLDMKKFIRHSGQARHINRIAGSLGLECHPTLLKKRKAKNTALIPFLSRAIYHCDEETMFKGQRAKDLRKFSTRRRKPNKTARMPSWLPQESNKLWITMRCEQGR